MGAAAVRHAGQILEHVETIVAIELLLAAQGIGFRCRAMNLTPAALGEGTAVAYRLLRERVPFLEGDVPLYPFIEATRQVVAQGVIKRAVEEQLGME